jgi:RDD family
MATIAPPSGRYCASCGALHATPDARFCGECGSSLLGADRTRPSPLEAMHPSVGFASAWRRLGAHLLDVALVVMTLVVGWLVWSLIVWGRGQTPAKQLLDMRVVEADSGRRAGWGRMCLRELPCKLLIGVVVAIVPIAVVAYFWLVWDAREQELWDKMAGTVVVNDPLDTLGRA